MNINSVSGKFEQLKSLIQGNLDILIITETKLDSSFPAGQFLMDGFSQPYRKDRDRHGGGILIYVREDIPSKELKKHNLPNDIEGIFVEINLRKTKWLIFGTYHPPKQSDDYYFKQVGNSLDLYCQNYEKFLLIGDFNAEESEPCLYQFLQEYESKNLVKEKTCFKSINNPSCIDLFITNHARCFQNTQTISTGLSDFHKMVVTVLRSSFKKAKPKQILYRDYKHFDTEIFKSELRNALANTEVPDYETFELIFLQVLERNAPVKKKIIRANHAPYVTKTLRKAIMKRSNLENKYYKNRTEENKQLYKKHKNFCSKLYKKEKKKYYTSLNLKEITDNKRFWKTITPFLSNKNSKSSQITLVNNDKIVADDENIATTFNNYFENAVKSLEITENKYLLSNTEDLTDPIEIAIKKFQYHPSILAIKEEVTPISPLFNFSKINLIDIKNEISKLDQNKVGTHRNIPAKHLKETSDVCSEYLLNIWNKEIIDNRNFPSKLKLADITPVFKKENATLAKNYRPVSVLPNVSKVFERIIQSQLLSYIDRYLSPNLCGYRKGYSTQIALIALIEKWKATLDKKGLVGAVLMDLSKAFDTINHELLIAKLYAYGFDKDALKIIFSYLNDRYQRTKINTTFSSWTELLQGVPQGSVLGPILFNIYLNDLFFILKESDVCNFADDTTPYVCDNDIKNLFLRLEHDCMLTIDWFEINYMKLNTDKCHLLFSGNKYEHTWVKLDNDKIWEENKVKLLGITIDKQLKFDNHVLNICSKAGRKLSALTRMLKELSFDKKRIVLKAFVESQFSYCPLVWMFHSRELNTKINRLHERALRLVYNDFSSSFENLLDRDKSFSIHHRNIQYLAMEMYKVVHGLTIGTLAEFFTRNQSDGPYLRSESDFKQPQVRTELKGKNSIRYLGPLIWNSIPIEIKNTESFEDFKRLIKKWKPENCPCRLCKDYIPNVGFINISE